MGFGMGFDLMFGLFPILFMIVFGIIIVMFVVTAVRGVSQWNKNNHSPRLTVNAAVVAKRELHSSSLQSPALSQYYVTFQFPSRDRMEFPVPARDYGLLAEGDVGRLTFRGEQYIRFEREL